MDLVLLAILSESITQYIKDTVRSIVELPAPVKKGIALAIALVIAFGTGLDLFDYLGIEFQYPYVGVVFTGIVLSRGANVAHDLIDRIKGEG